MTRRPSLPGAAELFRATSPDDPDGDQPDEHHPGVGAVAAAGVVQFGAPVGPRELAAPAFTPELTAVPDAAAGRAVPSRTEVGAPAMLREARRRRPAADRAPTGRERHEEKITVYCSAQELVDLETGRLLLRAEHGLAVDRGRIVREALAVVLADLEAKGESSILVRRLREG